MKELRDKHMRRWGALVKERATWLPRYQALSQYILPFSGRYFAQDRNRGDKTFNPIYDSTGTRALRILAAGMMAGMTSPARPWFRLAVSDPDLMEADPVKTWLNNVSQLMRDIFARSNTYRSLHSMYEELGCFATSANLVEANFENVIHNHTLTAGEYAIATDEFGRVNTLYREFDMTVAQVVEKFGGAKAKSGAIDWSNISLRVKNLWDQGQFDEWITVLHCIEPRAQDDRDERKRDAKNMAFCSCYIEVGGDEWKVLRDSGYKEFPGMGPRWHTRGGDVYGNGPAFEALGDIKQLQHEQWRKAQAIDYMVRPPIALPGDMKAQEVDTLPGGVIYLGANAGAGAARGHNLLDVRIDLNHLLGDIQDVRQRINNSFYADLFMMISNDQRRMPVTAREIAERHEEKLLMLGPVLERLHDEMLGPFIDITFAKMVEAGIVPPPPQEMQGADMKVEFVSTLAQAQRAVGLGALDRLIGTVMLVAPARPDAMDKIDVDQVIDKYSDMLAVDPTVIVADEKVALIRADRAKQQAAAQAAAAAPPMAKAAKDISQADPNQVRDVMQQFTGYSGG